MAGQSWTGFFVLSRTRFGSKIAKQTRSRKIRAFWIRYRSELIMWLYIVVLVLSPVADGRPRVTFCMDLLLYAALLAASYMATGWLVRIVVFPLAVIWLLAHIAQLFLGKPYLISPYIGLTISCAIIWGILIRFTKVATIARSALAEAIICYLVIAVAFSELYWIVNRFANNSFNRPVGTHEQSAFLYFSLTTLTTLGSGDLEPVNHCVRFIAAFESMAGIFYIAIVIARLVAGYRMEKAESA